MKKYLKSCFFFAPLAFILPATAATTAFDDFSSGLLNGGTGDWKDTSWNNATSNATFSTSATSNALVATTTSTGTSSAGLGSVSRQYNANTTDSLTIFFDFTVGSFPTAGGTAVQDRFELYGGTAREAGFTNNNTWMISGGQDLSAWTGMSSSWGFYNGLKNGNFDTTRVVNSGIALTAGNTYRFTIIDNPATASYTASVANLTTPGATFTSGSLGYRVAAATADPYIHFGARMSSNNDTAGFTVDNVSIIPEPSSLLLSSVGILALFRRRRS